MVLRSMKSLHKIRCLISSLSYAKLITVRIIEEGFRLWNSNIFLISDGMKA